MHTYLFKSKWFKDVDKYFEKRGNWRPFDEKKDKEADYIYLDGPFIYEYPELHKIHTKIKNLVDTTKYNIADKGLLYKNMEKYNPKICDRFMMKQYFITKDNYKTVPKNIFDNSRVWILKPIAGHSGIGINVFTKYDDFNSYIDGYQKEKYGRKGWVLAEYIQKPLLFMERKFHLRIYLLYLATKDGKGKGYILKKGKFFPAKKPFINDNYDDKEIHDSHYYEEIGFYIFPEEFVNVYGQDRWNDVFEQILDLGHVLTKLMSGTKGYEESQYNYEILALDVMIQDDFKIKLVEVNTKVGYACEQEDKCIPFNDYFLRNQFEVTIDIIIPPKNHIDKLEGYVEVTNREIKGGYYNDYLKYKKRYLRLKHVTN